MKITTPIVVCATAIVIALIVGVVIMTNGVTTDNGRSIIIQGMVTGVLSLVATLFVAAKAEQASQRADIAAKKADDIHEDLKNGLIPEKVKEAVTDMADDPTIDSVTINHNSEQ